MFDLWVWYNVYNKKFKYFINVSLSDLYIYI